MGLVRISIRASSSRGDKDRDNGHSADKFGNHTEFDNVFGDDLFEDVGQLGLFIGQLRHFGVEANHFFAEAFFDDVVEADESAAANKQDMRGVHLDIGLFGVFSASLRRDIGDGSFEHFQERLLDAFA